MFASLKHVQSPGGFRTWCSYPSLCLDGQSWQNWIQLEGLWVQFWSLGFVGLHLLSWLAGLPGSASTERGEGELGELRWDNVHVFFGIECWLVERFRGFQNLFTRAPVDFGWWGSGHWSGFKTVYLWLWFIIFDNHDVSLHVSVNFMKFWFYECLIPGFWVWNGYGWICWVVMNNLAPG